jgi:hypothetical protein
MAWKQKAHREMGLACERDVRELLFRKVSEGGCDSFASGVVPPPSKNRGMHARTRKEPGSRCSVDVLPRNKRALLWGCYKRFSCATKPFGSGGFSQ